MGTFPNPIFLRAVKKSSRLGNKPNINNKKILIDMKHTKCLQIIDKHINIITNNINMYEEKIKCRDEVPYCEEQYLLKNVEYLTFQRAVLKQVKNEIMKEVNREERNNEK